jgi:glycogen(starch) synthase
MRVLLVGPYPPPYGGMAVQIREWHDRLTQLDGFECSVLNIGESRTEMVDGCIPVVGYADYVRKLYDFAKRGYLFHLVTTGHSFKSWLSAFGCALVGMKNRRRTVLVFGSGDAPEYMRKASMLSRLIIRGTLRLGGRIVCRNEQMRKAVIGMGAESSKISVLPGFLGIQSHLRAPVPAAIREFTEKHSHVLGATVYVPESGVLLPEYGIELVIGALQKLGAAYPRLGVLVVGPGPEVKSQIEGLDGLDQHVMFTGALPNDVVLGVMKKLTIFVRPTYTDGDSISVREALALGIPVVASDTGYRPDGVILFKKGDLQDFMGKLRHAIESGALPVKARQEVQSDTATHLLNIYQDLVRGTDGEHQAMIRGASVR